jgi:hypothetical protein
MHCMCHITFHGTIKINESIQFPQSQMQLCKYIIAYPMKATQSQPSLMWNYSLTGCNFWLNLCLRSLRPNHVNSFNRHRHHCCFPTVVFSVQGFFTTAIRLIVIQHKFSSKLHDQFIMIFKLGYWIIDPSAQLKFPIDSNLIVNTCSQLVFHSTTDGECWVLSFTCRPNTIMMGFCLQPINPARVLLPQSCDVCLAWTDRIHSEALNVSNGLWVS